MKNSLVNPPIAGRITEQHSRTKALTYLRAVLVIAFTALCTLSFSQSTQTVTLTPGSGQWTPPAGVTNVKVEVWGGGGGGGGANGTSTDDIDRAGGGGGGGAYMGTSTNLTVVPGTPYNYTVGAGGAKGEGDDAGDIDGADGGQSTITIGGTTLTADGGGGGLTGDGADATGGAGAGAAETSPDNGHTVNAGGNGSAGDDGGSPNGGGGGGSAGSGANGGNASQATGGTAGTGGGVVGGAGASDSGGNGTDGGVPGAGGGGGYMPNDNVDRDGGKGGDGQIKITYSLPTTPSTPNLDAADDTGVSDTDNKTKNSDNLTFTGTNEAIASSTIRLYEGTTPLGPGTVSGASGTWSIDLSSVSEGTHLIKVRHTLPNGNFAESAELTLIVDKTGPAVSLTDPHPDAIVRDGDTDFLITATFVDVNGLTGTPTIAIGTAQTTTNMASTGDPLVWEFLWNVPAGFNGDHAVTITVQDITGNANSAATAGSGGTISWKIDNVVPTVSLSAPHPDAIVKGSDTDLQITATFVELNGLSGIPQITIGSAQSAVNMVATGNPLIWTYDWDVPSSNTFDGDHAISITVVTDVAGNPVAAPTGTTSYKIDNTPPTVTLNDDLTGNVVKATNVVNVSVVITDGANPLFGTATIQIGASALPATAMTGADGAWTYEWTVPAGNDGSHTVTIAGTVDQAGNPIGTHTAGTGATEYVIDNTGPSATLTDDHPDATVRFTDVVVITAAFFDLHGVNGAPSIAIGTAQPSTPMAATGDPLVWEFEWTVPSGTGVNGPHAVSITGVSDDLGNAVQPVIEGGGGEDTYTIDNTVPVITSVESDADIAGTLKIGQTITFTVTPSVQDEFLTITPTTYNGGPLVWSTPDAGLTYEATYEVAEGQSDVLPPDNPPLIPLQLTGVIATDVAGNPSAPEATSDVVKYIDANSPAQPTTKTAAIDGGTTVAGWYNDSNTGISFTVSIASDASLMGGIVQVLMNNTEDNPGFTQVGTDQIIGATGTNLVFTFAEAVLEAHGAFGEQKTLLFQFRLIDIADNATTTTTLALQPKVDRIAPADPDVLDLDATTDSYGGATGSVGTDSDNKTNSLSPKLTGTAEALALVTINSDVVGELPNGLATGGGTFSINIGAIGEGTHVLSAKAKDAAGNESGFSGATVTIEIDRTAPQIAGNAVITDNGGSNETLVFTFDEQIDLGNNEIPAIGGTGFSVDDGSIQASGATKFDNGTNSITLESGANNQWKQPNTVWTYTNSGSPAPSSTNYIKDVFGNEMATTDFTSVDLISPTLITGIVFDPNGVGPEKISFNVSEELNISEGGTVASLIRDQFSNFYNAVYTGKGTTNTLTVTSLGNNQWTENSHSFNYSGALGKAFDLAGNELALFANEPVLMWRVWVSSDNSQTPSTHAKIGDDVTLEIRTNRTLVGVPAVTIEGKTATVTNPGVNHYSAVITTDGTIPEGLMDFIITATEAAKTTVTSKTTNSSTMTFDNVDPVISNAAISTTAPSANPYAGQAKPGNTVQVSFILSEPVATLTGTIAGQPATITGTFPNYTAKYTLTVADPAGTVAFNISATDFAGHSASKTTTDNSSSLDYDKTVPTVSTFTLESTDPNNTTSVDFEVVFSEPVTGVSSDDFTTIGTASGGTEVVGVTGSGTTYTITVSSVSKSGSLGVQIDGGNLIDDDANNYFAGPYSSPSYTIFFPQPANDVTNFNVGVLSTTGLQVTWTDAVGSPLPTGYLITVQRAGGTATVPEDEFPVPDATDLVTNPQGALNVAAGLGFADFTNLLSGESYTFKIYSYTNSGSAIDYKLDGTIQTVIGATPTANFTRVWWWEDFGGVYPATTLTSESTTPVIFTFRIWDDYWGNGDNAPTRVSKIIMRRASGTINWFDALESVHIIENGVTIDGVIDPGGTFITFNNLYVPGSVTFGQVPDGSFKLYEIKIVLNPAMSQSLKNTIDLESFPFFIDPEADFTFEPSGSGLYNGFNHDFSPPGPTVQVTADRLTYATEPPLSPDVVYVKKNLTSIPVVRAVDIHGFTDQNYTNTLSVTSAIPITHSLVGVSAASPNAGVYIFPSTFQFTDDGTGLAGNGDLTVTGSGVGSKASGTVHVVYSDDGLVVNDTDDEPAIMLSTAVTSNSHLAFTFKVTEENIDGAPTQISSIKITSTDPANEVGDWSQAILGATLSDGTASIGHSSILADEINFTAIPNSVAGNLGYVTTNTPKTYRLFIWLKPTLDGSLQTDIDGLNFGFQVLDENIVLASTSSVFDGSQAADANEFGSRNNVEVTADRLRFIVQPDPDLLVNRNISLQLPIPKVEATDAYNRRDTDYTSSTITITNTGSLGMDGLPTGTEFAAGIFDFPNAFRFTTIGTGVKLDVNSTGTSIVSGTPSSTAFDVRVASSAEITPGGGSEPAQISSLVDTFGEKVLAFDFKIEDDPDAATIPEEDDGNPTLVTDVIIESSGANNTISNWSNVIEEAYLFDGTNLSAPGTITADQIIFSGIATSLSTDLGYIADGTDVTPSSKTYQLLIYLRTDIEINEPLPIDGEKFSFLVNTASITTDPNGSSILPSETEDSGAANEIDVDATQLDFTNIPAVLSISLSTDFSPTIFVEARDVNGNRDIDFEEDITDFGTITPATSPAVAFDNEPTNEPFIAGTFTFDPNFQFTSDGNGEDGKGTLVMSAGGISGTSGSITIESSFDSDLTFDVAGPSGSFEYINYLGDNLDLTNSVELAKLILTDGLPTGDTDGANTVLNSFTVSVTNHSNLKRVALYDGSNTEIPGTDQLVTGASIVFTPSSPIEAVDTQGATQGITNFSIRASFKANPTDVHDHDPIQFHVTAATLGSGSLFLNGPGFIAGVLNGTVSPTTEVNVVATQIDFVDQPSSYEGIDQPMNEPIAHARDANAVVDLDVTGVGPGAAVVSAPVATFSGAPTAFNLGVLEFPGFQFNDIGNGTLTVNAFNEHGNPITGTSSQLDVLHTSTALATSGVYTLNLGGGVKNKVIFGATFESPHGTSAEPFLEEFTLSFVTTGSITGVFENFRVYESTDNSYQEGTDLDVVIAFGAILTPGAKSLRVQFPTPRDLSQNAAANGGQLTYFLKVDVAESANPSTPEIRPKLEDQGFGQPTDGNIVMSEGSSTSPASVEGISYNFAAVLAPTVTSSYPASGQLNVDPTQPELELVFSVPIWTLDRKAKLYKKRTGAFVQDLVALNGFYDKNLTDPHSNPTNKAALAGTVTTPLRFSLPVMDANEEYYITMVAGSETNETGVMDEFGNLSLGISFSEVLYFKTANPNPPALLRSPVAKNATVTSVTVAGAVVNAVFDQRGKAFFMVVPTGNPTPTNDQIKGIGIVPYLGTVTYRGDFDIDQISPISQYGIINAALTIGQVYNVWICAESYSSKNHVETAISTSAPFGSLANNHGVGLAGPTLVFNGPASSSPGIAINPPTVQMCTNSFQELSSPIIITEGSTKDNFDTGGTVRTFNLLLPTGFQFDNTTIDNVVGGTPIYGSIELLGSDFQPLVPLGPVVGKLSFINNSILRIQFNNSGSGSQDKIIISGLRVFATAAGSGGLSRLGGTAIPGIPDESVFATLIAIDAAVIGFTNSYSEAEFPGRPAGQEVTIIPDNYNDPLFSIQLTPKPPAGDFGASSFSGPGVNVNNLSLNAVTLGVPFNIVISHEDNNGCVSQSPVQYLVYDHTKAIGTLLTEYCIENGNFSEATPAPATAGLPGNIVTIPNNNNPATFMTTMTADLPDHALSPSSTTQIMKGSDWRQIIQNTLLVQGTPQYPFGLPSNPDLTKPTHSYTFDVATILNANVAFPTTIANPYSHFRKETQNQNVYYEGGTIGKIEYTANYRSVANSQAEFPLKQEVEFWLPPIPIVEAAGSITKSIFCQQNGEISINGWPAATTGKSIGTFRVYDDATNVELTSLTGFTDFGNGTAQIDPIDFFNAFKDIRIEYTYKEIASPCERTGSVIIQVTPNPMAVIKVISPTCEGLPVKFSGEDSNFDTVTGFTVTGWAWTFGDASSVNNAGSGMEVEHTYAEFDQYTPTLEVTSSFGCKSTVESLDVDIGDIPVVNFSLTGISTGEVFKFTNLSSVATLPLVPDNIQRLDWTFGDGQTEAVTTGPFTGPSAIQATNQFGSPGTFFTTLKVTSVIGCDASFTKELLILDRRTITDTQFYEERFNTSDGNWKVAPYEGGANPSVPSWIHGVPLAGTDRLIKLDAINGAKLWITSNSTGEYNSNEKSAIYSPSFDMSDPALSRPMISMQTATHLAEGDGVVLEYSSDNLNVLDPAKKWYVLGSPPAGATTPASGAAWYNANGLASQPGGDDTRGFGWTGSADATWKESKHILDVLITGNPSATNPVPAANLSRVVFRIALASVSSVPREREGFAFDNVRIGNRTRTVLIENFRNLGSSITAKYNTEDLIAEKIEADNLKVFNAGAGTRLVKINYHVGFPRTDPFNLDNPQDPSARALYYGIKTTPRARLDGEAPADKIDALFSTWGLQQYNLQTLRLSEAEILLTATPENGSIVVNVGLRGIIDGKTVPAGTILHVAIVERTIAKTALSQTMQDLIRTEEESFEYVLKKMLPSAVGTKLTQTVTFGNTVNFAPLKWEPDLNRLYKSQNLSVIVFLQDEESRRVYQAEIVDVDDPAVVTGLEDGLRIEDVAVYPNPASDEMNIMLPRKAIGQVKVRLIDQMGKTVIGDAIPDGSNEKILPVRDLATGVYILQLEENGRTTFKKVMVTH
jgi:hypothetical protein